MFITVCIGYKYFCFVIFWLDNVVHGFEQLQIIYIFALFSMTIILLRSQGFAHKDFVHV